MSNLRKVIDLDESVLNADVVNNIAELVASGHKLDVLVINRENRVYVDPELAREQGYLDIRYGRDQE